MAVHRSLSDSKSPQDSRTLLSILADLSNAVVWMVFTRSLISKSSTSFNNILVTVRRAPIIIGINVTFMFQSFFNFPARSRYLSFFSFSFNFYSAKSTIQQLLIFLFFSWFIIIIIIIIVVVVVVVFYISFIAFIIRLSCRKNYSLSKKWFTLTRRDNTCLGYIYEFNKSAWKSLDWNTRYHMTVNNLYKE